MIDPSTLREARALIEAQGLRFETNIDDLVGLYENGQMIGCGARKGYVLKMLVIVPDHQGTGALGELVTRLILSGMAAGHETLFIYTAPQNASSFQALNFRLLVTQGPVALLEHGPGIEAYFNAHSSDITPGQNGAIVVNGNPFTWGHLHLVETAARQVDHLFLFVVREDLSAFPFDVRYRLAQEATAHLENLTVLDTSRYAVSAGTFPSYFLKHMDRVALAQMSLDIRLFAQRVAPRFHISSRFVGEEPLCPTTAAYNRVMSEVLQEHAIRWVMVPRLPAGGSAISATRVRTALIQNDFKTLETLVPPSTLAFLQSSAAQPIADHLRAQMSGDRS